MWDRWKVFISGTLPLESLTGLAQFSGFHSDDGASMAETGPASPKPFSFATDCLKCATLVFFFAVDYYRHERN